MKHLKLFEEYISEIIDVYHGSDRKFDTFDLNKIGSGDGKNLGGWGIYFSDSEDVAQRYFLKSGFVKRYQLRRGEYFNLDEYGDESGANLILEKLQNRNVSEDDLEEFQTDIIGYIYDTTNKQIYDWLSYVLGSEKEFSLFLNIYLGYNGNKFKDRVNIDATNYVVYDLDCIFNI